MFAPQVVTAIIASLLGAGLLWPRFTARVSEKGTYLTGLAADLAAMVLLVVSWASRTSTPRPTGCCWPRPRASARASVSRCRR